MQTSHHEVKRKEYLRVLRIRMLVGVSGNGLIKMKRSTRYVILVELLFVLHALDPQKCEAENQCQRQIADQHLAAAGLRRPDSQHDRQAAANKNHSVRSPESDIQ